jgi:hypothetical protein
MDVYVPGPYPQSHRPIGGSLQEEHRIVQPCVGCLLVRHFPAGEFGYLSHNSPVERPFWSSRRYIAQNPGLSGQPGIGPPLNIACDKLMKEYEDDHGAAGERQGGPQRDTPCGTPHDRFSGP